MPLRRHSRTFPRRGVVLLAVLIVVVVLSLAAYQYGEWINAEYRAADAYSRSAQAKALAESGVQYVAALLSNTSASSDTLNGNPWDNPQAFQNVVVRDNGGGRQGVFTIVGLVPQDDPNQASQPYRFGVIDEAGKINLNALLALDNGKGDVATQILMKLPNMTEDIANSILDWLDPDDTPRSNGAEDDYYSSLPVPYHCKNGPLDSLEELLLVKGVTPQLLYGNDRNRNGVLDADEDDGSGQVDLGWSAYLTVYSHEPNTDIDGNARIYLNDEDLNNLSDNLTTALGQDMANYIIAYRLYGGASSTSAPGGATGAAAAPQAATPFKPLSNSDADDVRTQIRTARAPSSSSNTQQKKQISSLFDLINSSVNVPVSGGGPTSRTVSLPSPLNDPGQLPTLLPLVLDKTTTSTTTDLMPRVNVNTAPQTVLAALPGLEDADVQAILNGRPDPSANEAPDPIFQTPAWLLTEANLTLAKVKAIAPYITARSQVYHFQSLGYFRDGRGPVARVEAIIDCNNGKPRVVYHRDLAPLGPGFDMSQMAGR